MKNIMKIQIVVMSILEYSELLPAALKTNSSLIWRVRMKRNGGFNH